LLEVWSPVRLLTSSASRCLDTVAPYAEATGLRLELREELTEEAFEDDPKLARALLAELRDSVEPVAICTHRPLLSTVARMIGLDLPKSARSNPLPKGAAWVAHPGPKQRVERYTA
jgi:8-oxo-dGTP diphosphatase